MNNPIALLYTALIARIEAEVPAIRFISQDLGQLDFYDERPPVSYPCVLIDIGDTLFSEGSHGFQLATAQITLRVAHATYSDVSNLPNSQVRELGLRHLELEHAIGKALHGWQPEHDTIGALMRVALATEKRDDNIRVRQLTFSVSLQYQTDTSPHTPTPLQVNY